MLLTERDALKRLMPGQEVLTYIANGDPIGNFRRDNDFGDQSSHVFLPILNGDKISTGSIKHHEDVVFNGLNTSFSKSVFKNGFTYHGIVEMFSYLKQSQIYGNKSIKII